MFNGIINDSNFAPIAAKAYRIPQDVILKAIEDYDKINERNDFLLSICFSMYIFYVKNINDSKMPENEFSKVFDENLMDFIFYTIRLISANGFEVTQYSIIGNNKQLISALELLTGSVLKDESLKLVMEFDIMSETELLDIIAEYFKMPKWLKEKIKSNSRTERDYNVIIFGELFKKYCFGIYKKPFISEKELINAIAKHSKEFLAFIISILNKKGYNEEYFNFPAGTFKRLEENSELKLFKI